MRSSSRFPTDERSSPMFDGFPIRQVFGWLEEAEREVLRVPRRRRSFSIYADNRPPYAFMKELVLFEKDGRRGKKPVFPSELLRDKVALRSSVNGDVARPASSPSSSIHISALAVEFGLSSGEVVRALQEFREKKREREQKEREEKERFAEQVKFLSIVDAVVDRLRPFLSSTIPAAPSSSLAPLLPFGFSSGPVLSLASAPSLSSFAFGPDQPPPLSPGSTGVLPASAAISSAEVAAGSAIEVKVKSEEKGKDIEKEKSKQAQQERDKELLAIGERELAAIVADLEKKFPDSDGLSKQFKVRGLSYKKGTKRGEALQLLAEAILKTR